MKDRYNIRPILFLLVFLSLSGCFKKEEFKHFRTEDYTGAWGLPLIDSRLTLDDIVAAVDNKNVVQEGDNTYTFYYRDSIIFLANDFFEIPSQNTRKVINLPVSITPPLGQAIKDSVTESLNLDLKDGSDIKSIILKGGNINVTLASRFKNVIGVEVKFLSLFRSDGRIVSVSRNLQNGESSQISQPLAGLEIRPSPVNEFQYRIIYTLSSNGEPITPDQSLSVNLVLDKPTYKSVRGKIGNISLGNIAGNIDIQIFDKLIRGNVSLDSTSLTVDFINQSFGIPTAFNIDKLNANTFYDKDQTYDITGVKNPFVVSRPEIGKSATTTLVLNKTNSNITEVITRAPYKINYNISSNTPTTNQEDFITDDSKLTVKLLLRIPFKGSFNEYLVSDTLPILDPFEEREYIDSAIFKMDVVNNLPLNIKVKAYFVEKLVTVGSRKEAVILDSAIFFPSDKIVENAVINSEGIVISPTKRFSYLGKSGKDYDKIAKSEFIILVGEANTPKFNNKFIPVQLKANNDLYIKLSVLAKMKVVLNTEK